MVETVSKIPGQTSQTAGASGVRLNQASSDPEIRELQSKWSGWQQRFLTAEGFVIDPSPAGGGKMVSEGLGYGMLMALIFDDQITFDKIFSAVKKIQKQDKLFGWQVNGRDVNSAADADEDIAAALVFAATKWENKIYLDKAREIISAIWEKEVHETNGRLVLLPSDNQSDFIKPAGIIINPSYFSPAWYRVFAKIDPKHNWNKLAEDSLEILNKVQEKFGQPIDWCYAKVNSKGEITVEEVPGGQFGLPPRTKIFGFDAVRVPLRLSFDVALHDNLNSKTVLHKILKSFNPRTVEVAEAWNPKSWHNEVPVAVLTAAAFALGDLNKQYFAAEFSRYNQPGQNFYGEWDGAKDYYYNQTLCLFSHLLIKDAVISALPVPAPGKRSEAWKLYR